MRKNSKFAVTMRILILSTSDNAGGAAIAARRLMHALNKCGHEARMLVRDKSTDDPMVTALLDRDEGLGIKDKVLGIRDLVRVRMSKAVDRAYIWASNGFTTDKLWLTDAGFCGCSVAHHPLVKWADVIHLHWVNQGFLSLNEINRILRLGKRVVWTLHDLWPLTGVCHLPDDCSRYTGECRDCPQLCRPSSHDLSVKVFNRKRRLLSDARNLTFTTVSTWAADKARQSALLQQLPIFVVPNLIDTDVAISNAPKQPIIVFGAGRIDHRIKGFRYLVEALQHLARQDAALAQRLQLITYGDNHDPRIFDGMPIRHTHLGVVDASRLADLYDKAMVVVSSSLYETFGQTLIEGALHGCVPVAFRGSGPDDIITHCATGYLARLRDTADLSQGIQQSITHHVEWSHSARQSVINNFSSPTVATQFINIYNNIPTIK